MNISGIPQLQAAGGFSIGEEVVRAEGHQSGTPLPWSAHADSSLAAAEAKWHGAHNRKSTLKQASRILAGRSSVWPDTSKQPQACMRLGRGAEKRREKGEPRCSGKHYSCWYFLFKEAAGPNRKRIFMYLFFLNLNFFLKLSWNRNKQREKIKNTQMFYTWPCPNIDNASVFLRHTHEWAANTWRYWFSLSVHRKIIFGWFGAFLKRDEMIQKWLLSRSKSPNVDFCL